MTVPRVRIDGPMRPLEPPKRILPSMRQDRKTRPPAPTPRSPTHSAGSASRKAYTFSSHGERRCLDWALRTRRDETRSVASRAVAFEFDGEAEQGEQDDDDEFHRGLRVGRCVAAEGSGWVGQDGGGGEESAWATSGIGLGAAE